MKFLRPMLRSERRNRSNYIAGNARALLIPFSHSKISSAWLGGFGRGVDLDAAGSSPAGSEDFLDVPLEVENVVICLSASLRECLRGVMRTLASLSSRLCSFLDSLLT